MQGPTPRWDQPPDSRDNTVSMPRVDPADWTDRPTGTAAADGTAALTPELPAFGDPYALPPRARAAEPETTAEPEAGAAAAAVATELLQAVALEDIAAPDDVAPPEDWAAPEDCEAPEDTAPPEDVAAPGEWDAPEDTAPRVAAALPSAEHVAETAASPEAEPLAWAAAEPAAPAEPVAGQAGPTGPVARQAGPSRSAATEPSSVGRPDAPGTPGRPAAGSILDLRARLATLPAGHPASPYDDAGRLKPAPVRLRQLELGLPARSVGVTGYAGFSGLDRDDETDDLGPDTAAVAAADPASEVAASDPVPGHAADHHADADPGDSTPERGRPRDRDQSGGGPLIAGAPDGATTASSPASGAGQTAETAADPGDAPSTGGGPTPSAERPTDGPATTNNAVTSPHPAANGNGTPREAGQPRGDRAGIGPRLATGQNGNGGRHVPPDVQHPRGRSADADDRGHGSAPAGRSDSATAPWPAIDVPSRTVEKRTGDGDGERQDPSPRGSAPTEAQRSQPRSAGQNRPDQGRAATAQVSRRPGAPPGPVPSAARLTAAQHELVQRILAACRAAEGRNAVGGYGSSGLTPAMLRIAAQLPIGGLAPGSEADTLKPADRLAAKLARLIARQPGASPEHVAASISDAIRYAFAFDTASYTEGTLLVHRKLKTQGFELEARRNLWDSSEYKGVFTRWRDPAHRLPFEVQFHTRESWAVVKQTHDAYARITDPATPPAERQRLREQQATATATVLRPPGWLDLADFPADDREQRR
ncbi:MAG TPA: hypothetical protein VEH05_12600 [Streptosporangiaceae bacterium]|nr:hypothetical protein [Streptosporangiaceae bacterium]